MRTPVIAVILMTLAAHDAAATSVRIHYEAGEQSIGVQSDQQPGQATARRGANGAWTYTWPDRLGDISMRPVLGKDRRSTGGTYNVRAGSSLDIYPFFGPSSGKVTMVPGFASPQLENTRQLRIYLPPSYDENRAKRYPVLYMHDGQNLFDAKTAAYGVEWGIDETIDRMVGAGLMDEIIVVGIDNTPQRIAEYSPCCDPKHGGGKLEAYRKFVVETVKPYVDKTLRTLPGREHSAIMGSSLGGIASVAIAQASPGVFSMAGGVSSSFWWNQAAMVTQPAARVPVKFYLDAGASNDGLEDSLRMRDAMLGQGYKEERDLLFYTDPNGSHNEKSWAARVDKPLAWFFPWGSTRQP